MRKLLCAAVAVVLISVLAAGCYAGGQHWRLSACQLQPVASELRDYGNNTRGLTVEYSLGDTFKGESTATEASLALSYMRLDYTQLDTRDATQTVRYDLKSDIVTVGMNWRFGAGAKPSRDGYYVGLGAGIAFGSPSVDTGTQGFGGLSSGSKGSAFEWRAMAGMNFASATFGEVTYRKVGPDGVLALNVGIRL